MDSPFSGIDSDSGVGILNKSLAKLRKDLEAYFNTINLIAFSPPGAQVGTIPEKPAILLYVEQIQSSGHLLMPGGLMQQPHIFMYEYDVCVAIKQIYENIQNRSQ